MAYFGRNPNSSDKGRPIKQDSHKGGGLPTVGKVKQIINQYQDSSEDKVFYELEAAEVIDVLDTEEKLPKDSEGFVMWPLMGCIRARKIESETDKPIAANLRVYYPLHPLSRQLPLKGEYVIVMEYLGVNYFTNVINFLASVSANVSPGKSGTRPESVEEEDFVYDYFELSEQFGFDPKIRRLFPYEGDHTLEGRFGNSIRFGSNIVPDAHEDPEEKQDSPNILMRVGQLSDAEDFGKIEEKNQVENTTPPNNYRPVKEDINADGSSIWMTTDQSVNLNIDNTNASSHIYMTADHQDDQPKKGGKQITINSDRITFNTKKGKILGFSHDGIGFSTQKSFTVDADNGMQMNTGGETVMNMIPGGISLITPGNSRLDLGSGGGGDSDVVHLSSECPAYLRLDDKAHLESCKGANVHLDDCAGLYTDNGSYIKIGGSEDEAVIYVVGRDDVKEQHLVFGEKLTEILEEMLASQEALIDAVGTMGGIPSGAGPTGLINQGAPYNGIVEIFKGTSVEPIRKKICQILTKV